MQQRKRHLALGLIILVTAGFGFLRNIKNESESEPPSRFTNDFSNQRDGKPRLAEADGTKTRADRMSDNRDNSFGFTATALPAPLENSYAVVYPKYRAGGSGTRGAIRDQAGNLIWRATKDHPVYSVSTSPDEGKIVVGAGDGNAYIITNEGAKIADLPQYPQGKDMLGMGNWNWLDNNRLLGESGVLNFDENGKPVGCCQNHKMSESRFYVYDLRTNKMEEMHLPETLWGKVVSIGKVLKTGEFQIGHEGSEFGWYQISEIKEKH